MHALDVCCMLTEHALCHRYSLETLQGTFVHATALLLTGDLGILREFMANSLAGATLDDESVRKGLAVFQGGPFGWRNEDGYCGASLDTFFMQFRCLAALVETDTDASRAALHSWLPPPAELLRIAEHELGLLCFSTGASHPSLLCARLHGECLGDWKAAAEVAEGVLNIEEFQPLLRTEAHRLLGRAKAELGDKVAACEAAERAATQAAGAKHVWLEMLSIRDLLRWCEAGEAEGVRSRLRGVAGRLAASAEELAGVLGEGVL